MINLTFPIDLNEPITFEDWLDKTDGTNTYKANLDSLLTSEAGLTDVITEWFFDWYIGWNDSAKFWRYLKRTINTTLPQYQEMLRIQPGYAKYDWMVQKYEERKLDSTIDSNGTVKHADDTKTKDTTGTVNGTSKIDGTTGNIRTGGTTETHTGTDDLARSGTDVNSHTGSDTNNVTSASTKVMSGGHTETDTEGTHTEDTTSVDGLHTQEYSPHVSKKTQNGGHSSSFGGTKELTAGNPMSKKYSTFISAPTLTTSEGLSEENYLDAVSGDMPVNFDWHTASTQGQNVSKNINVDVGNTTESYEYGSDGKGDVTTNQGTTDSPDTKATTRKGLSTDPDKKEFIYNAETETRNGNEDSTAQYNSKESKEYGSAEKTTHDTTDALTYDSVTDNGINSQTGNTTQESTGKEVETDTHGDVTNTGSSVFADKEITTGRDADMATLLNNAKNFIANSNAWLWFREQLIPCFESEMI